MSIVARFGTKIPTCCAVCRRQSEGIAYAPNNRGPFIWLCDDYECQRLAKEIYRMPKDTLTTIERQAALEAADAVGEFLDTDVKKTDLAKFTAAEWEELWRRFLIGYEQNMRRLCDPLSHIPG